MFKVFLLAATAIFSFAGAADASTLYVTLGDTYTAGVSNVDLYSIANIKAGSYSSTSGDVGHATGASTPSGLGAGPGGSTLPTGNLFGDEYVYIIGTTDFSSGTLTASSATYTLAPSNNTFGMTWGTIDTYNGANYTNTLTLTGSNNKDYIITGDDMNSLIGSTALVNSTAYLNDYQVDVLFYNPFGAIAKAVLTGDGQPFEAANLTAVPLPGALLLFGSGLASLAGVACKKRR